jgi:hypothetical protein
MWTSLYDSLSLLGKNSVKTFPQQRRIVEGIVFYAIHDVSKESRRLFIPGTSCLFKNMTMDVKKSVTVFPYIFLVMANLKAVMFWGNNLSIIQIPPSINQTNLNRMKQNKIKPY